MVKGNFDQLIKQETQHSLRNQDGGENARDRAARRMNVQSGKNPNPYTSTAYKPDRPAAAAKSKSSSGGKRIPTPSPRPSGGGTPLPNVAPIPTANPNGPAALPQVSPPSPMSYLLPLLIGSIAARKGMNGVAAGTGVPGSDTNVAAPGEEFPRGPWSPPGGLANGVEVPTQSVTSTNVPADPSALSADNVGRFFNEGEIADMQSKMKGVLGSPGWGPRVKPPEFDPNIHLPRVSRP